MHVRAGTAAGISNQGNRFPALDFFAALFQKLMGLNSSFYDRHSSGSLISRFTYDVTQIKEASTKLEVIPVRTLGIARLARTSAMGITGNQRAG